MPILKNARHEIFALSSKLLDKLKAIALDNDLSSEGSEANREDVTVVVKIGGQDNYETPFTPERPLRLSQGECVQAGKRA